jgi:hypothetical protein
MPELAMAALYPQLHPAIPLENSDQLSDLDWHALSREW